MTPYYDAGGVTIYHGDCREIVPALGLTFDCVMADPPYTQTSLQWDRWPNGWPAVMAVVSRSMWCFGSLRMFVNFAGEFSDWSCSQDLIWEKHNGSGAAADRFRRVHDQICHFYRGDWASVYKSVPTVNEATARTISRKRRRASHWGACGASTYQTKCGDPLLIRSVLYAPSMHGRADNETQKPESIIAPLIEYACPKGALVLSPFCGSGTDLVVAKVSGRRSVGIDSREGQCETAARRVSQLLPMELPP